MHFNLQCINKKNFCQYQIIQFKLKEMKEWWMKMGNLIFFSLKLTIESSLSSISICHDLSSFSIYKFQLWQFMLTFINYWQRYHDIFCIKTIKILIYAFNVWICRWWHLFNVLRNKPQPSPASIEYILPVNRKVQCILCFIVNK